MKKYELLEKVYQSNLPSRAKQIMFYIINRANGEGTCFPSVKTIASDCGVSERTIQRTMNVLLEEGFISKENRYRKNGGQTSNLYKLQIEPENHSDKKVNNDIEKFKEEKLELEKEKNDNLESIETVTFDDYIVVNETKENSLNNEKQTAFNSLVQKISQGDNFTIKTKFHPIIFQQKVKKLNTFGIVTKLYFQCHGVGDNLHPP